MALAARQDEERYMPVTKVYMQSRSSTAAQPAPKTPERAPKANPQTAPNLAVRPKHAKDPFVKEKLFLVSSIIFAAVLAITFVAGYAFISERYEAVTSLKTKITESERRINQLQVKLERAVSLETIEDAASAAGMEYPKSEQIVEVP